MRTNLRNLVETQNKHHPDVTQQLTQTDELAQGRTFVSFFIAAKTNDCLQVCVMQRRANYHPHTRVLWREPPRFTTRRPRRQALHVCPSRQTTPKSFVRFVQTHQHSSKRAPPNVVTVSVERAGSGMVVCCVKVFVDHPNILDQLISRITSKLNEPYGKQRQSKYARAWEDCDFQLFAGHNFDDQVLLSRDNKQLRFQVCCLAHTHTPIVVLRKSTAVWINVDVHQTDGQVRTVRDVCPRTARHILDACFPLDDKVTDYQVIDYQVRFVAAEEEYVKGNYFGGLQQGGYLCTSSCRVVVESKTLEGRSACGVFQHVLCNIL